MPAFTLTGTVYGQPVQASWDDGTAILDDPIQVAVDFLAKSHQGLLDATPTGPAYLVGLADWEQAYVTIRAAVEAAGGQVSREDGDLPRWPLAPWDRG